ncbi:hypothetical protein F2Q68_00012061 [Brassica cretica]|uniref:Uncharacterized protein n=1 Tax=Brassica cretica TaxID=69181 RepID=A0A8S9KZG4_BRACR|nr:hypothetical protein F2Q68_00012061 [Brassica cretica]
MSNLLKEATLAQTATANQTTSPFQLHLLRYEALTHSCLFLIENHLLLSLLGVDTLPDIRSRIRTRSKKPEPKSEPK